MRVFMKEMKRCMAFILALTIMCGLMPEMVAFAEEVEEPVAQQSEVSSEEGSESEETIVELPLKLPVQNQAPAQTEEVRSVTEAVIALAPKSDMVWGINLSDVKNAIESFDNQTYPVVKDAITKLAVRQNYTGGIFNNNDISGYDYLYAMAGNFVENTTTLTNADIYNILGSLQNSQILYNIRRGGSDRKAESLDGTFLNMVETVTKSFYDSRHLVTELSDQEIYLRNLYGSYFGTVHFAIYSIRDYFLLRGYQNRTIDYDYEMTLDFSLEQFKQFDRILEYDRQNRQVGMSIPNPFKSDLREYDLQPVMPELYKILKKDAEDILALDIDPTGNAGGIGRNQRLNYLHFGKALKLMLDIKEGLAADELPVGTELDELKAAMKYIFDEEEHALMRDGNTLDWETSQDLSFTDVVKIAKIRKMIEFVEDTDPDKGTFASMLYTLGTTEDYEIVTKYLSLMSEKLGDFLGDDWESLHTTQFYKDFIYKTSTVHTAVGSTLLPEGAVPTTFVDKFNEVKEIMETVQPSQGNRYNLFSTLDQEQLDGELGQIKSDLQLKQGLVAWYYTFNHSEDYDHDTNSRDEGIRVLKEEELVAVKYHEQGGHIELNNNFYGVYDNLGERTKDFRTRLGYSNADDLTYHFGLKKVVSKAYLQAPTTEKFTFSMYLDNQSNYLSGDTTVRLYLKDLDGNSVLTYKEKTEQSSGKTIGYWEANLTADHVYQFELQVEADYTTAQLPDQMDMKWSTATISEVEIPNGYFLSTRAKEDNQLNSQQSIKFVSLDPLGDFDQDGIPNIWETEGFYHEDGALIKYDPNGSYTGMVYYTSPTDYSTDGDPLSDLEEVIDRDDTTHPLIAAYPKIVAELVNITFNAKVKNKVTNKTTAKAVTKNASTNKIIKKDTRKGSTSNGFTVGMSSSTEAGYSYKGGKHGGKAEQKTSIKAGYNFENVSENNHATTSVSELEAFTSQDTEEFKSMLSTMNTLESADVAFTIKLKNIGNTTAYNINPTVTLMVGDSIINTVNVPYSVNYLSPNSTSGDMTIETTAVKEGTRQVYITANQEILEKVYNNYPITLSTNDARSEVIVEQRGSRVVKGEWNEYVNQINGITATINHTDATKGLKTYKIFANKEDEDYKPELSIFNALRNIYTDGFEIRNNNVYINNKPITNINIFSDNVEELSRYFNNVSYENGSRIVNITNLTLRPGMVIDVETSLDEDTKPYIFNTLYKYGKIQAYVMGNCSNVATVKAVLKIDGANREVTLTKNEDSALLYEYDFGDQQNIDIDFNNRIVATDENGNERVTKLYVAEAFFIREQLNRENFGTKYIDLETDFALNNITDVNNLISTYPADRYVIYKDHSWSARGNGITNILTADELRAFGQDSGSEINKTEFRWFAQGYFKNGDTGSYFKPINQSYSLEVGRNDDKAHYNIINNQLTKKVRVNNVAYNIGSIGQLDKVINDILQLPNPFTLETGEIYKKDFKFYTGITNATGYVAVVGSSKYANLEENTSFTINGRVFKAPDWDQKKVMTLNNLIYIEANAEQPDEIDLSLQYTELGLYHNKKYELQIIGYYTEDKGLLYKPTDDINVGTVGSDTANRDLAVPDGIALAKGYMLKIEGINMNHYEAVLEINGVAHARGYSNSSRNRGFVNYLFVPSNYMDPSVFKVKTKSPSGDTVGNYNIKIVGYYY